MRILIAEDEERARRGLRSVLTSLSEDYEVVAGIEWKAGIRVASDPKAGCGFYGLKDAIFGWNGTD